MPSTPIHGTTTRANAGRPRAEALVPGEAAILAAMARADWTVAGRAWTTAGPAMLRLPAPPGLLPWTGRFEVAIPLAEA